MAGRILKEDIDEVRARINLADVVGDYVSLKPAGIDSLKGLCPFHDERSPSFHVRPGAGRYHCFGCGEGGDVYSFLMQLDHVTFAEAVERMAQRVGMTLRYEDGGTAKESGNRARLLAANRAAAEFFAGRLSTPAADPGRRFLGERGFDRAAAAQFGVGFAPKSWDELTKQLRTRGFTDEELLAAGLVSRGDRGVYDRFRGRLVWPIRDLTGEVVGFGARRLLEEDTGPKYLNTPETAVYHKAQVLYGLDLAKRDISRGKRVVVVEGYTDVMACHLAGVTTAVATCGTSFGVDHIRIVRRVLGDDSSGGEVIFTFDPDAAGEKAAIRAFGEEQRFAAQTYVATGPDGLDPCDLRLARGDEAVRAMIDAKKPMFEFIIRQQLRAHDLETVEGRVAALRAAAPVVAEIRDPSLRPGYARELARWLGVELGEVQAAVAASPARRSFAESSRPPEGRPPQGPLQSRSPQSRPPQSRPQGGPPQNARHADPAELPAYDDRDAPDEQSDPGAPPPDDGAAPAAPADARPGPTLAQLPTDPATRLERDALMAVLQFPALVGEALLTRSMRAAFANRALATVRDAVASSADVADAPAWLDRVTGAVPPPLAGLVQQLAIAPVPQQRGEEALRMYVRDVTARLVERDLARRKSALLGQLQRTAATEDPVRWRALQQELMGLEAERRSLREP